MILDRTMFGMCKTNCTSNDCERYFFIISSLGIMWFSLQLRVNSFLTLKKYITKSFFNLKIFIAFACNAKNFVIVIIFFFFALACNAKGFATVFLFLRLRVAQKLCNLSFFSSRRSSLQCFLTDWQNLLRLHVTQKALHLSFFFFFFFSFSSVLLDRLPKIFLDTFFHFLSRKCVTKIGIVLVD